MNVSISAVVDDLGTTVSGVQSAIALEALVSAAFILIGSKIGDLIGRKRAFILGLSGYALGALTMAVTNLAAVRSELAEYDPAVVQGSVLERSEIERQIEEYRTRSADERRAIIGLQPGRAAVILAGACVVATVLDLLGRDSLTVSDRGVRHGLLAERFGD
jgi:exopolyphosphatase/guanosine-5'-triphosphate,3'-diphosphate pyrophosphatase